MRRHEVCLRQHIVLCLIKLKILPADLQTFTQYFFLNQKTYCLRHLLSRQGYQMTSYFLIAFSHCLDEMKSVEALEILSFEKELIKDR